MVGVVAVVTVCFSGYENVQRMVNVIIPLRGEETWAVIGVALQIMTDVVSILKHQMDVAVGAEAGAYCCREFGENVRGRVVEYCVHRVEAQSVKMVFFQPIERIMNEIIADGTTVRAVEIDGLSPRSVV